MTTQHTNDNSPSSEEASTSIDNATASAEFAPKAKDIKTKASNTTPEAAPKVENPKGTGIRAYKFGPASKVPAGVSNPITFQAPKKPAPPANPPLKGDGSGGESSVRLKKVVGPALQRLPKTGSPAVTPDSRPKAKKLKSAAKVPNGVQVIRKSTENKVRSGKPGLDQFLARMSPACQNMMDFLAGQTGAPYELSLPALLHVHSLALSPRLRVKQGIHWTTPVLQMLIGAQPKVGKSVVNTFIIGLLHEMIDSGVFPDVHEMDFSKAGLLESIAADPWNAMSISDADASDVIKVLIGSGRSSFSQNMLAKGWCGERYKRSISGKSIVIPHLYLGTALFVQPERVDDFLCNRSVREKGLVNRTLLFQALHAVEMFETGNSIEEAQGPIKNLIVRLAAIRRAERSAGYIDVTLEPAAEKWLEENQPPSSVLRWSELTVRLASILHVDRLAGQNPEGELEPLIKGTRICPEDIQAAAGLVDLCESYTRNVETFCEDSRQKADTKKADQLEAFLRERGGSARLDVLESELHMARKTIRTLISMFPDRFREGEPIASGKKGQPAVVICLVEKHEGKTPPDDSAPVILS